MKPLVSVIMPNYNSEKYIKDSIESVLNQTYSNLELIIVDDISNDSSIKIIKEFVKSDKRVKFYQLDEKGGASKARNLAISKAKGKYVAFLDSDDLWKKEKLEKQINFMEENDIYFSYTDYEYIDENRKRVDKYRKCPSKVSYFKILLGCSVGCLTVVYNRKKVGLININKIDKRNDYAIWCKVLKKVRKGYKYDDILSYYRKSTSSLSSGKKYKLLKYHYDMHRKVNNFNPIVAVFFTITNTVNYFINTRVRDRKM